MSEKPPDTLDENKGRSKEKGAEMVPSFKGFLGVGLNGLGDKHRVIIPANVTLDGKALAGSSLVPVAVKGSHNLYLFLENSLRIPHYYPKGVVRFGTIEIARGGRFVIGKDIFSVLNLSDGNLKVLFNGKGIYITITLFPADSPIDFFEETNFPDELLGQILTEKTLSAISQKIKKGIDEALS